MIFWWFWSVSFSIKTHVNENFSNMKYCLLHQHERNDSYICLRGYKYLFLNLLKLYLEVKWGTNLDETNGMPRITLSNCWNNCFKKENCISDFSLEVYKKIGNKNFKFYVDCHKSFLGMCLEMFALEQCRRNSLK